MLGSVVIGAGSGTVAATATIHIQPAIAGRGWRPPPSHRPSPVRGSFTVPCYDPAQFQTAYDERPLFSQGITGAGQTIVIVDSFGSPTIQSDLATFDGTFDLPAPPSFKIIQPAGAGPALRTQRRDDGGWAGETTLDVEWSHAMAPGANILLVETPVAETEGTAGFPQIVEAENYVIDHHLGDVISQSFGATEQTFPTAQSLLRLRSAYINAYRTASPSWPHPATPGPPTYSNAAGTLFYTHRVVVAPQRPVGHRGRGDATPAQRGGPAHGTGPGVERHLQRRSQRGLLRQSRAQRPRTAAAASPLSSPGPIPEWRGQVVGDQRGVPDIAMSGACSGLVNTYQSFPGEPPAGMPRAGPAKPLLFRRHRRPGRPGGSPSSRAHQPGAVPDVGRACSRPGGHHHGQQHRVVHPERGPVHRRGFSAGPGYDLASGVGTVDAALFVPELATASRGFTSP